MAEGIVAVSEDGSLHQLGMSIQPEDTSIDTDGDGVNDNIDRFKWDYNYQFDSDEDGLPDKYERKIIANNAKDFDNDGKLNWNDPDSDNDGIWDGEDTYHLIQVIVLTTMGMELTHPRFAKW